MLRNFISEFKRFAVRGNAVDMAVGIVIGAAFTKVVDSLVKDVLMPPLGIVLGKIDFSNLFLVLKAGSVPPPYNSLREAQNAGAAVLNFGGFLNAAVSFVIVAFAVFMLIKLMNALRSAYGEETEAKLPAVKTCPFCLSEIPEKAVKCPNCTADLPDESKN